MERALAESNALEAERKALDLISRAPHTKSGLRIKLLRRGFDEASVEQSLRRMEEMGYIDDAGFCEQWLHSRLQRHPEGRQALLAGLIKRGISPALAQSTLDGEFTADEEEQCARRVLAKLPQDRRDSRTKVARRLSARGFGAPLIYRILEEMPSESPED